MSGNITGIGEPYNHFIELSKPTKEDLKRVFTKEELKELCLKHKCKVDIWRWNAVNDYRVLFTKSGRYQRWCEKDRLRMLAKAVNKMKPFVLYDEHEITRTRKEEWKFQLKENILSLNFWKRQRTQTQTDFLKPHAIASDEQLEYDMETSQPQFEILSTTSVSNTDWQSQIILNSESTYFDKHNIDSGAKTTTNTLVATNKFVQNIERNIIEADFDEDYLSDEDPEDFIEALMLSKKSKENSPEILNSDDVAPEIENIYDINTMSMTIDSDISIQSQDLGTIQSQHIPHNYDHFKKIIPATSTQSPKLEIEEIIA